jgi:hypothetical protein
MFKGNKKMNKYKFVKFVSETLIPIIIGIASSIIALFITDNLVIRMVIGLVITFIIILIYSYILYKIDLKKEQTK